jgi:hypothetical protein
VVGTLLSTSSRSGVDIVTVTELMGSRLTGDYEAVHTPWRDGHAMGGGPADRRRVSGRDGGDHRTHGLVSVHLP